MPPTHINECAICKRSRSVSEDRFGAVEIRKCTAKRGEHIQATLKIAAWVYAINKSAEECRSACDGLVGGKGINVAMHRTRHLNHSREARRGGRVLGKTKIVPLRVVCAAHSRVDDNCIRDALWRRDESSQNPSAQFRASVA